MKLISFNRKMANIRKSREQKIKADSRHFNYHYEPPSVSIKSSPKLTPNVASPNPVSQASVQVSTYPYLKHDLLKTLIVTSGILAAQILTFLLLKNHTFPILGIRY